MHENFLFAIISTQIRSNLCASINFSCSNINSSSLQKEDCVSEGCNLSKVSQFELNYDPKYQNFEPLVVTDPQIAEKVFRAN